MGALHSLLWSRGGRAAEQPPAVGDEEAAQPGPAAVREEAPAAESRAAQPGPSGRPRRKARAGGPMARKRGARAKPRPAYETLFLEGKDSDIQIRAFGEEWNLHRAYLCRSGYFASMFSGAWRETNMKTVEIQMPDQSIDRESFHEVLGYLYRGTMNIPACRVTAVLATASMLQLNGLIQQCEEIMRVSISAQTVSSYYYSAENYGLHTFRSTCHQWLLDNLMTQQSAALLREVTLELMKELVASSELVVMEAEMDVYTMLKRWMFLKLEPAWTGPPRALLPAANAWLARYRENSDGGPFLDTEQGRAFVPAFQKLRLAYMMCDLASARLMDHDALIPASWLTQAYKEQRLTLLHVQHSSQLGPLATYVSDVQRSSMRCGGLLCADERCSWSWVGFSFGWDLVVYYTERRIVFRRTALHKPHGPGASLLCQRKVAFRLRLISLDRAGRPICRKDTNYRMLSLRKDEEVEVMNLEHEDLFFPIYVACNFLYFPGARGAAGMEDPGD